MFFIRLLTAFVAFVLLFCFFYVGGAMLVGFEVGFETAMEQEKANDGVIDVKKVRSEAKQKAANKIVKKMGDKGRYDDANQMKTLVVMQVLGDTKSFFDNQAQLQDTPGFFDNTKVPDAQISDNNVAAYFMIQGSDARMDALTDLQYK